jgi:hypothetical protein
VASNPMWLVSLWQRKLDRGLHARRVPCVDGVEMQAACLHLDFGLPPPKLRENKLLLKLLPGVWDLWWDLSEMSPGRFPKLPLACPLHQLLSSRLGEMPGWSPGKHQCAASVVLDPQVHVWEQSLRITSHMSSPELQGPDFLPVDSVDG